MPTRKTKKLFHHIKEIAVAMDLAQQTNGNSSMTDRDTLYMLSGVALIVFGAGLILSNPLVRRYLGQAGIGSLAQAALPDIDRYLKLRSM
jgi:hypothetical protein